MGRILVAGLVAGIVVFCWAAVAHMLLPLGMVGMKVSADATQQNLLTTMHGQFEGEGIYMLPMPQQAQWEDQAAMTEFGVRAATMPYAFVVYQPQGRDGMASMGRLLANQAGIDILAGLLAAFVAAAVVGSRMKRVAVVTAMGIFSWLTISVPYWNWYRFPADFTGAALIEHGVGWLLGGLAIAFVLKPREA